jgi:hypothetical protein
VHESEVDRARLADGYLKETTLKGKQRLKLCVEMNRAKNRIQGHLSTRAKKFAARPDRVCDKPASHSLGPYISAALQHAACL